MLAAAAVIEQNSSFQILCQTSGVDQSTGLNALNELLSAQLLVATADESRPFVIFHERIREAVYAGLAGSRWQYHHQALITLEALADPPATLAYHAHLAQQWDSAFHFSLEAGDSAMRLFEIGSAAEHFENAIELLRNNQVDIGETTQRHLYGQLGRAYELTFQFQKALTVYDEMEALALEYGSPKWRLEALLARVEVLSEPFDTFDEQQAAKLIRKAIPLARSLADPMSEAHLERSQTMLHIYGDRQLEPALHHARSAVALARQAGDLEQLALALIILDHVYLADGQLEQCETCAQEAIELFTRLDHRPKLQDVLHGLALIRLGTGNFDAAADYLEQAFKANEALGSQTETLSIAGTRSAIHIIRGDYDKVPSEVQPLLALDESEIASRVRAEGHQQLAWAFYDLGAHEQCLSQCKQALAHQSDNQPVLRLPALAILAALHIERGEIRQAARVVANGLKHLDLQRMADLFWWETFPILIPAAELALVQGEHARAKWFLEQLLEKYEHLRLVHLKPAILKLQGKVLRTLGDYDSAYQTLSEALELSDLMGSRREVWAICGALSQLEKERREPLKATRLQARAREEVAFVAAHAGTPELRAMFLRRPEVQRIFQVGI